MGKLLYNVVCAHTGFRMNNIFKLPIFWGSFYLITLLYTSYDFYIFTLNGDLPPHLSDSFFSQWYSVPPLAVITMLVVSGGLFVVYLIFKLIGATFDLGKRRWQEWINNNEASQLLKTKELYDKDLLTKEEYESRIAAIKAQGK